MRVACGFLLTGLAGAALILSGCDRAEPAPEQTATSFSDDHMPGELESVPDEPASYYIHPHRGFALALPHGWAILTETATGASFAGAARHCELHITASTDNRPKAHRQAIAAFRLNARDVEEVRVGEYDYRAVASDDQGQRIRMRALRGPEGTIVARMRYPQANAAAFDAAASASLDSLSWKPKD